MYQTAAPALLVDMSSHTAPSFVRGDHVRLTSERTADGWAAAMIGAGDVRVDCGHRNHASEMDAIDCAVGLWAMYRSLLEGAESVVCEL